MRFNSVLLLMTTACILFLGAPSAGAKENVKEQSVTEISVTLFGQRCQFSGPVKADDLKKIHELGPEAVYLDVLAPGALKRAGVLLTEINSQPPFTARLAEVFEPYRRKLIQRTEALLAFLKGTERLRSNHNPGEFMKSVSGYIKGSRGSDLEKMASNLSKLSGKKFDEGLEEFFEAYSQLIEPDAENEFHRSIKALDLHYNCTFDNYSDTQTTQEPKVSDQGKSEPNKK